MGGVTTGPPGSYATHRIFLTLAITPVLPVQCDCQIGRSQVG